MCVPTCTLFTYGLNQTVPATEVESELKAGRKRPAEPATGSAYAPSSLMPGSARGSLS